MAFNNTPGAVHYDQYLTSFATNYYAEQNYLAGRVFPVIDVAKQSDKYYVFDAENENREFTGLVKKAAPLTSPNMIEVTQSDDSYFSELYWVGFYMDMVTEANEDQILRTRERKARLTMDNMMKKRDRDWIDTYLTSGVWGEDLVGTTDFTKWSDSASTPIDDIMLWKEDFEIRNYGLKPNKIVITKDIKRHLLSNTQILGRINGGATVANPAMVNDAIIASIFEVDEIIWADAVSNKKEYGETEAAARMVTDRMLMVHSPNEAGIDVASAGAIFAWNQVPDFNFGISVASFTGDHYAAKLVSEEVHVRCAYDMKVTGPKLGTYISDLV